MSEQGVRRLLAEIIGNPSFAEKFFTNPIPTANESGFALTDKEIEGIAKLRREDIAVQFQEIEAGPGVEAGFEIDVRTAKF